MKPVIEFDPSEEEMETFFADLERTAKVQEYPALNSIVEEKLLSEQEIADVLLSMSWV